MPSIQGTGGESGGGGVSGGGGTGSGAGNAAGQGGPIKGPTAGNPNKDRLGVMVYLRSPRQAGNPKPQGGGFEIIGAGRGGKGGGGGGGQAPPAPAPKYDKLFSSRQAARAFSVDGWRLPPKAVRNFHSAVVSNVVRGQISIKSGRITATPGFDLPREIKAANENLRKMLGGQ